MKSLNELNAQIQKLQEERIDVINKQNNFDEEKIKSLEWTKDYCARFEINALSGAGLPAFSIKIFGSRVPHARHITVMGTSSLCEYNMIYNSTSFLGDFEGGEFTTSDEKILFEFLDKAKFKKLDFNENTLRILKKLEEVSKSKNM